MNEKLSYTLHDLEHMRVEELNDPEDLPLNPSNIQQCEKYIKLGWYLFRNTINSPTLCPDQDGGIRMSWFEDKVRLAIQAKHPYIYFADKETLRHVRESYVLRLNVFNFIRVMLHGYRTYRKQNDNHDLRRASPRAM